MQFAKDSFFMALRERLISLNPQRTVTLNGSTRPAVIVAENELVIPVDPLPDAFYLEWGASKLVAHQVGTCALAQMDCVISYHTLGTSQSGIDRGRSLAQLDTELLSVCQPARTAKCDFSQSPSVGQGTNVFWTMPELGEISGTASAKTNGAGAQLQRKAQLKVFFFSEVNFL